LEVQDAYDPGGKSFCAEQLWHSRYKSRVGGLVGFNARSSHPEVRTREAYELACDVIREAMPPCRNCGVLAGSREIPMPEGTAKYGGMYYFVRTATDKIYLMADRVEFTSSGGVIFWGRFHGEDRQETDATTTNFALAAGEWKQVYAASVIDGHPVAVEHWDRPKTPKRA
jgi:hypothetical protein